MDGENTRGANFVRVGGEGIEDVTDPSEIAEVEGAIEQITNAENNRVGDAQSIFALLQPESAIIVVPTELEVMGKKFEFGVRQLAYAESSRIEAKRYRKKPNGQIELSNEYAETVGAAWQISECIMRDNNAGKTDANEKALAPDWVKMFTLVEVLGTGKGDGLMGNPNPEADLFIHGLIAAVWEVNSSLNPLALSSAMAQIGMG